MAHEPSGEMEDDEAFELLGLASLLMRRLNEAQLRKAEGSG